MNFLRSLSFFDNMRIRYLNILASKALIIQLQTNTLISRQDKKSKYLYFVSRGRVKIIRELRMPIVHGLITEDNYSELYKDPEPEAPANQTWKLLLEIAELGHFECFGEDYRNVSNFLLSNTELAQQSIPYSVVCTMPTEIYCVKKRDFYEYIDDRSRKRFMLFIR